MTYNEIVKKYLIGISSHEESGNLILCYIPTEKLVETCVRFYKTNNLPLKTIKAVDEREKKGGFKIFYIFGIPHEAYFLAVVITLRNTTQFPSLVKEIYQVNLYEAEIATLFGLTPVGHPKLQQFILHENWPSNMFPLRRDFDWKKRPSKAHTPYEFQVVRGEGIYEIPVGPIHAGIIEPGHFRFSVAGEEIIFLEPKLGYTHKGSEKLFEVLPLSRKVMLSERISGDNSVGHALAFCQAVETISKTFITSRAKYIRVIFAELERIANHLNDVGFILNDTAFGFGGSNGMRLKERIMQLNDLLAGHRFLRGVMVIGGVTKDISEKQQELIRDELTKIEKDFAEVVSIAEDSETVTNRLKKTGILERQVILDYGVVGVSARASGLPTDARFDYPYAGYKDLPTQIVVQNTSDVYARYHVRIEEISTSINLIMHAFKKLKNKEAIVVSQKPMKTNAYAVGIAEGWRGDIVYFISTDAKGNIDRVGVRDASFLNWPAVPHAVVGNIVPDFPLINKSFNLSYSGFDR